MLLHRFTFINAMVLHLAQFANSKDLSELSSSRGKPRLSSFRLEQNNCIFGVRRRKPGLWNPPISMCGLGEIQLQVFTRNSRLIEYSLQIFELDRSAVGANVVQGSLSRSD